MHDSLGDFFQSCKRDLCLRSLSRGIHQVKIAISKTLKLLKAHNIFPPSQGKLDVLMLVGQ